MPKKRKGRRKFLEIRLGDDLTITLGEELAEEILYSLEEMFSAKERKKVRSVVGRGRSKQTEEEGIPTIDLRKLAKKKGGDENDGDTK